MVDLRNPTWLEWRLRRTRDGRPLGVLARLHDEANEALAPYRAQLTFDKARPSTWQWVGTVWDEVALAKALVTAWGLRWNTLASYVSDAWVAYAVGQRHDHRGGARSLVDAWLRCVEAGLTFRSRHVDGTRG